MVALTAFLVVALAVLAFTTDVSGQQISTRMINGISADTMKRFPHHVSIKPLFNGANSGKVPSCAGSIITDQWVLTSLRCVQQGDRFQIDFQKLNKNNDSGSYSVVVNNDEDWVVKYPKLSDDIAMIRIPSHILFSNTVKPIELSSSSPAEMERKLAVLPGFDKGKDQLTYSMLSVASNGVCSKSYGNNFDEYLNMCAKPMGRNNPCTTDFGSGLVIGWPSKPELVGIYSSVSKDCDVSAPSVYINLFKYQPWINSVIGMDLFTTTMSSITSTSTAAPMYT